MKLSQALFGELWDGEKSICIFVHLGRCFWVVDYKYNFCLDAEKDYRAYLDKGYITKEQYFLACNEFRGGLLKLTSDNFLQYIGGDGREILSQENLKSILMMGLDLEGDLYEKIEQYYLSGAELNVNYFKAANAVASRLPMFYVNFDREIYLHMDNGRAHEDSAYPGWFAKCADFGYLIPDREKYWVLEFKDYWKFRFL
ncbi:hypothetical protein [Pseudomonas sp. RC3H12]|jgi:hypothetical protein|uniref:hypothetical protein n=1 Tax=Pseudomonas sp. RC3H12 TaxID=2834406 RepID=UPI001BDF109A|nr:hypothetical protein [Pseudomonas sp. RC3H12]QWA30095.1 hypothetical protein KHO27_04175 [Pseudomonas sp. RC3H12]